MSYYLRPIVAAVILSFWATPLAQAQQQEPPPPAQEGTQEGKPPAADGEQQADAPPEEELSEEELAAKHFAQGRQLYVEGKYLEAISALLKAYELRPAPPILLNIARTYERLDDKKNALKYYKEFLLKARMVDPNRPQVEEVVKKLEQQVGGKTGAVTDAGGAQTPSAQMTGEDKGPRGPRKQQLIHTPVDAAKVRQPITIMVELPPQVEADKVLVNFRQAGELQFRQLQMEQQGEAWVALIPARYVTSTSLQYYLEALKGGKVVASTGRKNTPHIIVIEGGRAPTVGAEKELDIHSPYRIWLFTSAAATAAFLGGGLATALLARDRENAIEKWVDQQSCAEICQAGKGDPSQPFNIRARDWESEGETFALMGKIFLGLGVATAGATAYLFYLDRQYVKQERRRLLSGDVPVRFVAAPWAGQHGAGLMGRIDF